MDAQPFLSELGRRLRAAREARGTSLAQTARDAGVSRRYLTDAEAGRANPSVEVCLRLCASLGLQPGRLFDIPLRRAARERIALVGLRGAGKTTVGRLLAQRREAPFVELDERVEALAGLSLAELFDVHGEAHFRALEAEALEGVLGEGERVVIATGGSIVTAPRTFERVLETCRTVWLRASSDDHFGRVVEQGDRRPMRNRPRAREELDALLAAREPLYARCELTIETSGRTPDEVLDELESALDA